jgi:hypothetical protein
MIEAKKREWPWDGFPQDGSTWLAVIKSYEQLASELTKIQQERDEYKAALERLCDQIEVAGDFMEFSRSMNKPCIINHVSFSKNSSKNARAVLKKWSKPEDN